MKMLLNKWTSLSVLFLMIFFILQIDCKKQVKIGGIFHDNDPASQMAFKYAVERNNRRGGIEFVPLIRTVSSTDSYRAGKVACNLTGEGVAAIFGPESQETRGIVESICKTLKIPNFQTFSSSDPPLEFSEAPMSLNFHPDHHLFEKAIADVVLDSNWETFSVLYEDDNGLGRIQKVLENINLGQMRVMQLTPDSDNLAIFHELSEAEETHIILDCSKERILEYLRQAREAGMLEPTQTYILTSLDAHIVDYGEFKNVSANITALRVAYGVVLSRPFSENSHNSEVFYDPSPDTVSLNTALMIDAVTHLTESLNTLLVSTRRIPETKSTFCDSPDGIVWNLGKSVYQYIAESVTKGMTGDIHFKNTQRGSVNLEIVELSNRALHSGVIKIGDWNIDGGISYIAESEDIPGLETMWKVFIISSKIGEPYLRYKIPNDDEVFEGNERYEGYALDLMDGIAEILNISYAIELTEDNRYGLYNKTAKAWTGILGDVIKKRADAGIADITISQDRLKVVDFSIPFMQTGIGLLYSKPDIDVDGDADGFSFLQPFSSNLWVYLGAAYIAMSIFLYILARISSNQLCKTNSELNNEDIEKSPPFFDCLWIPMANFVSRGGSIMSRNISSRMTISVWWFFTIILISFYTANLTAFKIKERKQTSFHVQIEDLPKQNKIKYGVLTGGSTSLFFKNSEFPAYRRIWENINADASSDPMTYDGGIELVTSSKGTFGFLMETSTLEYVASRDCSLTQLGQTIASRSYGIAMSLNSPYRSLFNQAILKMKDNGMLDLLKNKWWNEMNGGGMCDVSEKSQSKYSDRLDFPDISGLFAVLMYGTTAAVLVAIVEFMWHVISVAKIDEITVNSAFHKEWDIARRIWTNKRPARNNVVSSTSHSHYGRKDTPMKDLQTAVC